MNLFVCWWLPGTYVGPFHVSGQDFEPATLTIASKATPEPGSFLLLATGTLALIGFGIFFSAKLRNS